MFSNVWLCACVSLQQEDNKPGSSPSRAGQSWPAARRSPRLLWTLQQHLPGTCSQSVSTPASLKCHWQRKAAHFWPVTLVKWPRGADSGGGSSSSSELIFSKSARHVSSSVLNVNCRNNKKRVLKISCHALAGCHPQKGAKTWNSQWKASQKSPKLL